MSLVDSSNDEIFIVDDDAIVRKALSMMFSSEGFRVTLFEDATSFVAAARLRLPACVLLDVHMPGKSGLDILQELDAPNYPAPILIMSGRGDIPTAVVAIKHGAFGFIQKGTDSEAIIAQARGSIKSWADKRQLSGDDGELLPPTFPGSDRLTPREREVLAQVTAAASNKEAANNLGISQRTVEVHRIHIMQKLGAKNTADLIRIVLGRRNGMAAKANGFSEAPRTDAEPALIGVKKH
jgi:two-component system, LuxR family, response regulator FixJ